MIGLFDSGSGGLTVLSALRTRTGDADVVYFGDIANAPYGEREPKELIALTKKGIRVLADYGVEDFISACNSVSLSVLQGAAGENSIIEMTRPTARFLRAHAGKRMLLLATPATIRSHIYQDAIGVSVLLHEMAIPLLAGAIEFGAPKEEIRRILQDALSEKKGEHYDGIILGCTHYPLVRDMVQDEAKKLFGKVELIDPADAVADEVMKRFDTKGKSTTRFLISKESDTFRKRVHELFPSTSYTIEVI